MFDSSDFEFHSPKKKTSASLACFVALLTTMLVATHLLHLWNFALILVEDLYVLFVPWFSCAPVTSTYTCALNRLLQITGRDQALVGADLQLCVTVAAGVPLLTGVGLHVLPGGI